MSPAATLAWFVVGGALVSIVLTESVTIARASATSLGSWSPSFGRFRAAVGVAILLASLVRLQSSIAATPPPSERIAFVATDAGQEVVEFVPPLARFASTPDDNSHSYTVAKGDTLWGIARGHITADGGTASGSAVATFWRAIFDANRTVIGNDPNLILPGQLLAIPGGSHG